MGDAASPPSVWKTARPFVLGGASGMAATVVIQPVDMIKVTKQLAEGAWSHAVDPRAARVPPPPTDVLVGSPPALPGARKRRAHLTTGRVHVSCQVPCRPRRRW